MVSTLGENSLTVARVMDAAMAARVPQLARKTRYSEGPAKHASLIAACGQYLG